MSSATATRRAVRPGSCTDASFGAVFRYPLLGLSRGLAGRAVLPSVSPGGAHGVLTLRRFAPECGWSRRVDAAAKRIAAFLSDRAHLPFVPLVPPRFILVGVTGRRLGK